MAHIAADGTWTSTINGQKRIFKPTLDEALAYALEHGQCDLTNTQAVEYVRRFPLTDNQNEPHELHREIIECDCECDHQTFDSMCFTTVTADDISDDAEELDDDELRDELEASNCYQVWRNPNYKPAPKPKSKTKKRSRKEIIERAIAALEDAQSYMETSDDEDVQERADEIAGALHELEGLKL